MNGKEGMTGLERGGGGGNLSLHEKHTELFKKAQRVSEKELSLFQKDEGMFPKGSFLRLL